MSATREVAVVGGGLTKFGVRPVTWAELAQEAGEVLFRSVPHLEASAVDSLFVGAAEPERFAFQSHVAPLVAEQMGLAPHRIVQRNELACASGQSAIRSAYAAIRAGLSDVAVAVGVEKMNIPSMGEANSAMACVLDRPWDAAHGLTAPPFFAMVAQRHMLEHGTTEEQLAAVSEKNHRFANANPVAQFHEKRFDREKLLRLPLVAPPLRLGDCSSMTDGAGAVVLVAEDRVSDYTDTPAWIRGTGQYADFHNLANMESLTDWTGLTRASREAFRTAGIGPTDCRFRRAPRLLHDLRADRVRGDRFLSKGGGRPVRRRGAVGPRRRPRGEPARGTLGLRPSAGGNGHRAGRRGLRAVRAQSRPGASGYRTQSGRWSTTSAAARTSTR